MSSAIESLPTELFLEIASYLQHGDLFCLTQVSRTCNELVEPALWTKIEFHRPSFHEDYAYPHPNTDKGRGERPYSYLPNNDEDKNYLEYYYGEKSGRFTKILTQLESEGSKRLSQLASRVRWLCLPFSPWDDDDAERSWNIFPAFQNLEYLEVHTEWSGLNEAKPFQRSSALPLTKLHTVKLRGYVPRDFVLYVCQHSDIVDLELAVLDTPIGGVLPYSRINPPPDQVEPPEDYEGMTDQELDALDDVEDFEAEGIAPRPLWWMPEDLPQFTFLTHLWLCKPAEPSQDANDLYGTYYSEPSDQRALEAWASIIRGSRRTLTYLTLEDRLTVYEIESDSTDSDEYMQLYSHGPSYKRFVAIVLPALLEEAEWASLKQLQLYGLEVYDAENSHTRPPDLGVRSKLRQRHPRAEIETYLGRRMLFDDGNGQISSSVDVLGYSL